MKKNGKSSDTSVNDSLASTIEILHRSLSENSDMMGIALRKPIYMSSKSRGLKFKFLKRSVVVFIVIATLIYLLFYHKPRPKEISYALFKQQLSQGEIEKVTIKGDMLTIEHKVDGTLTTNVPDSDSDSLWVQLIRHKVMASLARETTWVDTLRLVVNCIVGAGFIAVFTLFLFRYFWVPRPGRAVLSRFRPKLLGRDRVKVTLKDVVLPSKVREQVDLLTGFLKNPKKYQRLGGKLPKAGFLLVGPSGTGKSICLRAIAGEVDVPCFAVSGSEFADILPGFGASRVRDLFGQARENAPCMVFIDHIEVVARNRSQWPDPLLFEHEVTFMQLLSELDDSAYQDMGVIFFGATDRLDLIDEALVSRQRLRVLEFSYPTQQELVEILKRQCRKIKLGPDVDLAAFADYLVEKWPHCTGAATADIVNLAAAKGGKAGQDYVTMELLTRVTEDLLNGSMKKE